MRPGGITEAPQKWRPCDLRCDCCLELEATIHANRILLERSHRRGGFAALFFVLWAWTLLGVLISRWQG